MYTVKKISIGLYCIAALGLQCVRADAKADELTFRANMVKSAFQHAWNGYTSFAYGHDELQPITNGTTDSRNGWGASIFDALDTMIIMGLEDDYQRALEHVKNVDWTKSKEPSKTFETNIRYLGGLLSAYDLRPDPVLLDKAVDLAEKVIMPAFNTPNRMPAAFVNVVTGRPVKHDEIILAEFGSLQLELVRLSQLTGDDRYQVAGNHILEKMSEVPSRIPGLYPMTWNHESFTPKNTYITISGGADSYYEYLLKTHILMEGNEELQLDMWKVSVDSMQKYLRSETHSGKVYLAEFEEHYKLLQTGELVCFMPGNLLLGARYLNDPSIERLADELMNSCYDTWVNTATGLAPEKWSWIDKDQNMNGYPEVMQKMMLKSGFIAQDTGYDLRPETIESLFYFYRITGDTSYQDKAWKIFEAIEKYCKTTSGYTRIADVTNMEDVKPLNFEESYFFAETLKYLYLMFSDPNYISLDEYVFNTEAHPFKLNKPIQIQAKKFK
ncbi:glycoside hydrolase family 47 protein [Mucor lusitanicus]|uniref:alpha-1,2-Mannosidase n=2 Tax=Mucor circinelloides f. lusitanicus TaxID=29924 RepID=A0A168QG48_MUCCL|nr:glycoside hydrolase family 47 protein [Mucor lusitanicus]OAD09193.1 glycoside hydrolase family 47 protein [Mucor lusitanicus CBS 277.49]